MRSLTSAALVLVAFAARGQYMPPPGVVYLTSGGECILSWAVLDAAGDDRGSVVRCSPFFNMGMLANMDLSDHAGLFIGLTVGNEGFIRAVPDTALRFKYRTYDLGVPVGLKFGRMNEALFFAGYSIELPVNYKEKRFANEKKEDKFNVWFSDRTAPFFQTVFAGVQLGSGICVKVKYHLTSFHDQDFTSTANGISTKPYDGLKANIFSVSLGLDLFRWQPWIWEEEPVEQQARLF